MELNELTDKIKSKFKTFLKLVKTKPGSENDESIFPVPALPEVKTFESSPFIWSKMLDNIGWRMTDEAEKLWNSAKTLREKSDMIFSMFYRYYRTDSEVSNSGYKYLYDRLYYSISVALARTYFDYSWSEIVNPTKTAVNAFILNLVPIKLRECADNIDADMSTLKGIASALYVKMYFCIKDMHNVHGGPVPEDLSSMNDFSQFTFEFDKNNRIYELQAMLIQIVARHVDIGRELERKGM